MHYCTASHIINGIRGLSSCILDLFLRAAYWILLQELCELNGWWVFADAPKRIRIRSLNYEDKSGTFEVFYWKCHRWDILLPGWDILLLRTLNLWLQILRRRSPDVLWQGTLSFGKSLSYFCINLSLPPHAFSLNIVCHTLCLSFTPSCLPHLTSSHTHTLRIILELWDPLLRCVFRLYLIIWISWKKRLVHISMPALQLIHFTR